LVLGASKMLCISPSHPAAEGWPGSALHPACFVYSIQYLKTLSLLTTGYLLLFS